MKKLIFALLAALILAAPAFAAEAETASLPSFKVTLNGVEVKNEYREYPLFVYNGITYFPMTYFDCRFLGLTTEFEKYTGLNIQRENISGMYRDYAADERNRSSWNVLPVVVPEDFDFSTEHVSRAHFPALINGKRVDESGDYPFLSFRGVTYFPLTWEYAHDMFGWEYGFGEDGLVINSANAAARPLALPSYNGRAIAHDGVCVYYQGADGDIYRAPINDPSREEKLVTVAEVDNHYDEPYKPVAELMNDEGTVYAWYHTGGATMGTDFAYILRPEGEAEPVEDYWRTNNHNFWLYMNFFKELRSGGGAFSWNNNNGDVRMTYGGEFVEGNFRGKGADADRRQNWDVSEVSAFGTKFYAAVGNDAEAVICSYDAASFTAIDSLVKTIDPNRHIRAVDGGVLFNRGGDLWLWRESEGSGLDSEVRLIGGFTLIDGAKLPGGIIAVGRTAEGKLRAISVDPDSGRMTVLFETEAPGVNATQTDEAFCVATSEEVPDENVRLAVFSLDGGFANYFSCDMAAYPSVHNGILIYAADGKAAVVNLDMPAAALASASGDCGENGGDNAKWELSGSTLRIYGSGKMADYMAQNNFRVNAAPWYDYRDSITDVVVESGITTIGMHAFSGMKNITSVTLPEGLTEIRMSAFEGCGSLGAVSLPSTLKEIGGFAFLESGVAGLNLPAGLETIGSYAFAMSGLKELYIPDGVSFGDCILRQCPNLESVRLPEGPTSVPEYSYILYNCPILDSVTLPDSLEELGTYAIFNCPKLKNIELGAKLKKLGYNFSGCGIASLTLPDGLTEFDGPKDITYYCSEGSPTWKLLNEQGIEPKRR